MADYDPHRDDVITSAYDTNAEYWTRIVRAGLDRYQQELTDPAILAAVGDCSHQVIVDAGCGEGTFTMTLARQGVAAIYGVDTCLPLIAAARQLAGQDDRYVTFRHGNVDNIDLPDGAVDVVVCNRIPHALTDPGRRFHEFARILRPGGRLVALSQHPCFYSNRQNRNVAADEYFRGQVIEQPFKVAGEMSPAPSVQPIYSLSQYASMITDAGFVINKISEPHPTPQQWSDPWWIDNFTRPLFLLVECFLPS